MNDIINNAQTSLGVSDLEGDLTDKLNGKTLPQIIDELNQTNGERDNVEAERDKFKKDLEEEKKEHAATTTNLNTEKTDHQKTKDQLVAVRAELDSRPKITQEEHQKLFDNQIPNDLPKDWQEQLNRIPGLEANQRPNDLPID